MAAAGFRTRKVRVEASIGDSLKRARTRQKLTVTQVEEATKIRAKFITALEADSWDLIPNGEAYGRGYLETYAGFLKLQTDSLLSRYDSCKAAYHRTTGGPIELAPRSRLTKPGFLVTPRMMIVGVALVAGLFFTGVIGYQLNRYVSAPFLEIATPVRAEGQGSPQLDIGATTYALQGTTVAGATVSVNGAPVSVNESGAFSAVVPVQKGVNAVVVEATSPSGKSTKEVISVTVK
jgi:cytoskeletal protein RodZ